MNKNKLKTFAKNARNKLITQIKSKLDYVLNLDSLEIKNKESQVRKLKEEISNTSIDETVEKVSYIWFNRLIALRFMDVNDYHTLNTKILSAQEGHSLPEILQEAKRGNIDDKLSNLNITKINDLFDGKINSKDAQGEIYQMLLVSVCNYYHKLMPFMFEKIEDFTELLLPDNLLTEESIIKNIINDIDEEDFKDVEIIGWLYQFYISEKKDEVFEKLKKNVKITPQNIPAATQLFTPKWIVKYMVENSLGRLWLENKPNSKLKDHMKYYIDNDKEGVCNTPLQGNNADGIINNNQISFNNNKNNFVNQSMFDNDLSNTTNAGNNLQISSRGDVLNTILQTNGSDEIENNNQISSRRGVLHTPEDIKIVDPCCGSGHILVYAFDLLTKIYEEEGYDTNEIPYLILEKNLYGMDIDDRAGSLANFALIMKARGYYKRFFKKEVETNVIALQNDNSIEKFKEAKNFGSLIEITNEEYKNIKIDEGTLFEENQRKIKKQALLLSQKYHCVITNPPYMGGKGMNPSLSDFVKQNYPDSKSDLFAVFIEKCLRLSIKEGFISMVTMNSWMFLSSYEDLRKKIINNFSIDSILHLGMEAFDGIIGKVVQTVAFTLENKFINLNKTIGIKLTDFYDSRRYEKEIQFFNLKNRFTCFQKDFEKIPGSPIAYWVNSKVNNIFSKNISLSKIAEPKQGLITGDNEKFLRFWNEVDLKKIYLNFDKIENLEKINFKWFPYNKGGDFKKYYGNNEYIVNWENDGYYIKNFFNEKGEQRSRPQNLNFYFRKGITWSKVTSSSFSVRFCTDGYIFSDAGMKAFTDDEKIFYLTSFMNSKLVNAFMKIISPTLNYEQGNISNLPIIFPKEESIKQKIDEITQQCIDISKEDWDSRETSWDFTKNELLKGRMQYAPAINDSQQNNDISTQMGSGLLHTQSSIESIYQKYCEYWKSKFYQLHSNEEELNRLFIDIYELQDELTPDVELKDITILKDETIINDNNELEFKKDNVIKQFISYAVGCMFGRYSLDKEGLILANQGETLQDFLSKIPESSFTPKEHNVIPILDEEYFKDDIVNQFKEFVKVSFGEPNYQENINFIESAIGKDIRNYFLKDFYEEHIRRYKKRPIYWLFSSEKGAFNALIYMHRYKNDTASIVLNEYLREYVSKLEAKRETLKQISISESVSPSEKKKADKEISIIDKKLKELEDYEKKLLNIANQKIDIDLDDGVKVNYTKFKDVLYKIKGLDKEE